MENRDKDCPTCENWYFGRSYKRCEKHNPKNKDRPTAFAKSFLPQFFEDGKYPKLQKWVEEND